MLKYGDCDGDLGNPDLGSNGCEIDLSVGVPVYDESVPPVLLSTDHCGG